jgi:hypothetical protein
MRPEKMSDGGAETLALRALAWLAADPERLEKFLAETGLGPAELKERATDPALLGGVLDHLLSREDLLLHFAEENELDPAAPSLARAKLPGATPDY